MLFSENFDLRILLLFFSLCTIGVIILIANDWLKGRRKKILSQSVRIMATVSDKHETGGDTSIRHVPLMKFVGQYRDREFEIEQSVRPEVYFHYDIGDRIELLDGIGAIPH